jgi:hypothetical protein
MTTMLQAGATAETSNALPPLAVRPSRLMAGVYRDIGLAAVAAVLEMPADQLDRDVAEAVRRGARYICLMPRKT